MASKQGREPTSGTWKKGDQPALKHGIHAVKRNGKRSMTNEERSLSAELYEQTGDVEGVIEGMRQRAERAEMLARMAEGYISQRAKQMPIDEVWEMPIWKIYGTLAGEARRCWSALIPLVPDNRGAYEAEFAHLDRVIEEGDDEE